MEHPMPKPPRAPTRRRYTPALKADGKRRYEQTDEQASLIAADFGIHPGSFWRLAKREGWVRYVPPPRDISSAAKLQVQAEALEQALHPPLEGEGRTRERSEPRAGWGATPDAAREAGPSPHPGSHRTAMLADPPPCGHRR
jgi:transposase-like protein